jgi:histidine ammonia-lyase
MLLENYRKEVTFIEEDRILHEDKKKTRQFMSMTEAVIA